MRKLIGLIPILIPPIAQAGAQIYEPLSASTRTVLQRAVSDQAISHFITLPEAESKVWLVTMSGRLKGRMPDHNEREDFLTTVHYEATRAGLDPQLVLSIIHVESGFRKYAISTAGARGYMQIMPFWVDTIGSKDHNLFHLRVNLRYGCTILRHYLDIEKGDYFRTLGRYNGSLGQATYPELVFNAWNKYWRHPATQEVAQH
ncbi:lytic transglycosylase domain-containing protein [Nitrosomonas sp. Nm58]|uniref:lytic transglycosylase domain-containing protein n=1 Tax=Nitrosomonas sp. Nm58 TaxID=200126 RepID=UPI00089AD72A|nr:lytic transglycosylase domain-containing protein [Nitrosomonas sp. Nm58]SDY45305.1 Transglycosylase SLT domain-containing protein [Nitrosomonas sp. Nm58]